MKQGTRPRRERRYKRREDVLYREIADEGVVYDPRAGALHTLNPSAKEVWECCDGEHTTADIVRRLCSRFEVDEVRARRDVRRTLKEFQERNLLIDSDLQG